MPATLAPTALSLKLGDFDLVRGNGVQTIADGMTFGEADPVEVVQKTLLQDGDAVRIDRYGNRTITYQVKITGSNTAQVAARSARLDAEIGRASTLTYTPPDGEGPPSVFDVFTSTKSMEFNDWGELKPTLHGRVYTVTLRCHPFCRSEIETIVAAIGTGETPPALVESIVDDCSAVGGWTNDGVSGVTLSASAGNIRLVKSDAPPTQVWTIRARRNGVVSMTDTPYLVIDVRVTAGNGQLGTAFLTLDGGAGINPFATGPSPDDSAYVRLWFKVGVTSFSYMTFGMNMTGTSTGLRSYAIDKVVRTNASPRVGSGRQQFRLLQVGGSARAVGSLLLEHETDALGQVLVYTNADDGSGYQPACRQFRVAGGTESIDSTTISGGRSPLNGATETFLIPISQVPAGTYSILGRVRSLSGTVNGVTTVTAATRIGSSDLGVRSTGELFSASATSWSIIDVGRLTLPAVAAGADAYLKLTVAANVGVEYDEIWIFNTDIGALTRVDCGTAAPTPGGSSNRLWIETASLEWPRPAIWMGTEADSTDRRHILAATEQRGRMTHRFPPGTVNLFTVTSNAVNVAASLRFYERWMDLAVWPEDMELAA